jgi:hypothetical protein
VQNIYIFYYLFILTKEINIYTTKSGRKAEVFIRFERIDCRKTGATKYFSPTMAKQNK